MTLLTTTNRVTYPGNASVGPFTVPFRFTADSELKVIKILASGIAATLARTTDYTVDGAGESAGSITLVALLAVGEAIVIRRLVPLTQATSIRNQGSFFAATHEDAFDRNGMVAQQLQDGLGRSVHVGDHLDPASMDLELRPETGKALVWQSATELGNSTLDSGAIAIPGGGRTVATLSAYLLNNAIVNVKDFGAVGDGVEDDTTAIALALETGKSVYFPPGIYSTTGTHVLGRNVDPRFIGQGLVGAGRYGAPTGAHTSSGTKIIRRSGTNPLFRLQQTHQMFSDVTLDGNGAGGNLLEMKGTKYSTVARVTFQGVGGTGIGLRLYDSSVVNGCSFQDLHFADGNYGHIKIENALYSSFYHLFLGTSGAGKGIDMGAVGGQAAHLNFYGVYTDAPISLHDNVDSIGFFGLACEALINDIALEISGVNVENVVVNGFRVQRNIGTVPVISVTSSKSITIRNFKVRDASAAAVNLIELNAAMRFTLDGASLYCDNAVDLIECVTARSDHVTIRDIYQHSGATVLAKFWCAYLLLMNVELQITFLAGNNDATIIGGSLPVNAQFAGAISMMGFQSALTDGNNRTLSLSASSRYAQDFLVYTSGAAMAVNAALGEQHVIEVSDNVAITLSAPTNGVAGRRLILVIKNASGGAMGAITWNAAFKKSGWTNPANGFHRVISFEYDSGSLAWMEVSQTAADVPN